MQQVGVRRGLALVLAYGSRAMSEDLNKALDMASRRAIEAMTSKGILIGHADAPLSSYERIWPGDPDDAYMFGSWVGRFAFMLRPDLKCDA